jgi:hypothetical protein
VAAIAAAVTNAFSGSTGGIATRLLLSAKVSRVLALDSGSLLYPSGARRRLAASDLSILVHVVVTALTETAGSNARVVADSATAAYSAALLAGLASESTAGPSFVYFKDASMGALPPTNTFTALGALVELAATPSASPNFSAAFFAMVVVSMVAGGLVIYLALFYFMDPEVRARFCPCLRPRQSAEEKEEEGADDGIYEDESDGEGGATALDLRVPAAAR